MPKNPKISSDDFFMRLAIQLAKRGVGAVSPNPPVGALVVKNNRQIALGYHAKFGGPHAEVMALKKAGKEAQGGTLYVTLEPCSTFGKTPPCINAILASEIKRVVVGCIDPNPLHKKQGIRLLKKAGVEVTTGILEDECHSLIKPFQKWMTQKLPYCVVKSALSLDGKIATPSYESQWITGKEARKFSYELRRMSDGIIVGINTVLRDDPRLTLHQRGKRDPFKIVVDSSARIPLHSKLVSKYASKVILATTSLAPAKKMNTLKKRGIQIVQTSSMEGKVHLRELFVELGKRGIISLLVEGGGTLAASIFENKLADRIVFFYAPLLIGGSHAPTPFHGKGVSKLSDALKIIHTKMFKVGDDFVIEGDVSYKNSKIKM
ncbi:MAG: bifunctional diaminohydroxyphosphoribosylaminopyrimidine deaminase/5-amino-6-(5-phosphoribosylamino)uracil reductase RibD [Chlamydiae bacterium]|nr:bifunctional diaminohydroxyphosphoribosylaminopyrimidine deaminase/5-amino-6-(5-phosphoribosylamino)uracil reductase RibD [Chlamydiota bacterium]MBI3277376.1 bifunctional diaminohydroxyphosphoribosylaminopyrimidine deaminase/5-amino-6-(5-phosphoribosylamino)uracil reductase RibD [Chlamydiota bacterium]